MDIQKRVAAIHDISGFGKCALTVALPVISAAGIETSVIPTAVLSTHTGGISGFTYRDLTDDMPKIIEHWKSLGLTFNAIYSGYLGSQAQIDIVGQFIDSFRTENCFALVDPAMADNGKLYTGFTPEFAKHMGTLCAKADIIVPNMTEASFMLGIDYVEEGVDEAYVEDILKRLNALGATNVVLTGVSFDKDKIGFALYESEIDKISYYFNDRIDAKFHGTGDIFSSVCIGGVMRGISLYDSLKLAADYTRECIRITMDDKEKHWYGVKFEEAIPYLLKELEKYTK